MIGVLVVWALAGWLAAGVLLRRDGARAELVARASHELRGPLTAALLALEGLGGERAGALEVQLTRARLALDDLNAAPSGTRAPDRLEALALPSLMAQVALAWMPAARAQGRELQVAPGSAGLTILGDRTRLAQAVGNLIANALEHTDGAVDVRARVLGERVRLEVRDEGPGLAAPLAEIAARPRRGRGRRGRGLAIAAGIAERHGGRLTAAPSPTGAALVLDLPAFGAELRAVDAGS